jgi:membrane protease YdiL (CAAX protease family)
VDPGSRAPSGVPPAPGAGVRIRWGIPDAALVYFAGLVGALVTLAVAAGVAGVESGEDIPLGVSAVAFAGQFLATFAALVAVSRRKGRGRLRADFGLEVASADAWIVLAGLGLQVGLGILVHPLVDLAGGQEQAVVDDLQRASGLTLASMAIIAALLAPVLEEVLFRGLLLRALLRRTSPTAAVAISALTFGLVHVVGDPSLGVVAILPALVGVGLVAGVLAVRSGSLSQPILLHIGFNVFTVVGTLLA